MFYKFNYFLCDIFNDFNKAKNVNDLNFFKSKYFGKKSYFKCYFDNIKYFSLYRKFFFGKKFNKFKVFIEIYINLKKSYINNSKVMSINKNCLLDITLPGRGFRIGSLHPITIILVEIESFFYRLGFDIVEGFEVEDDYHNFQALNMGENYSVRDMHDTFYLSENLLLRTHTSSMQIRTMSNFDPPFFLISSGRVFRRDLDFTHTPMFHQIEGLVVDKNINLANLKWILIKFLKFLFRKEIPVRFRSSFFPFTEPSFEVDIQCVVCLGNKCRLCDYTGWLEVIGCGMVHPNVLNNCNIYNYDVGFAFGAGVDRLCMLIYGIDDLRLNFENDLRFLKQF